MKAKPAWGRLITEARVVAALVEGRNRLDLASVLWAVKTESRTQVLEALLDGPATSPELRRRTGSSESTQLRALKELRKAQLIVTKKKGRSHSGPRPSVYEISPGEAVARAKKEAEGETPE